MYAFTQGYRRLLGVSIVLGMVSALAGLAMPMAARSVLNRMNEGGSWPKAEAIALLVLLLASAVLGGIQLFLLERTGERIVLRVRTDMIERLIRMRIRDLDSRTVGDLLSRTGADTAVLRSIVTGNVLNIGASVISIIGSFALMAYLDWVQLLVVLVVIGLMVGVVVPLSIRIRQASKAAQAHVSELTSGLERVLSALRTVKAHVTEPQEISRISSTAQEAYRAGVHAVRYDAIAGSVTGIAVQCAFLLVLGVGGMRVASGAITATDLIAILLYTLWLGPPIGQIASAINQLQRAAAAAERIDEVLHLPREPGAADPDSSALDPDAPLGAPALEFDQVSFQYRADVPILKNLTIALPAGTWVAFVGASGAGKTTVFSLLERFYEPDQGRITIDGANIADMPLSELRQSIGYIEQGAPALAGTIRDNLTYGVAGPDERSVNDAIDACRLRDLIDRLPEGLDTPVGERGITLSGGERQRLAIGRLLLQRRRIVLLDEATSALDTINEQELSAAIAALARQSTVIVIAHRLATVVDADLIVVLDHGEVVASGTHVELMASSPHYQALVAGQLLGSD